MLNPIYVTQAYNEKGSQLFSLMSPNGSETQQKMHSAIQSFYAKSSVLTFIELIWVFCVAQKAKKKTK